VAAASEKIPTLDFWFEFASTYSYPAAMRVAGVAHGRGVALRWRPFLLGPIFAAQGWSDSPFNLYPVKGRYMWRDLERICARLGLPMRHPSRFPRNGLLAARVALLGAGEAWVGDFVRAVYRANFGDDREISAPEVIGGLLADLGVDADAVLGDARSAPVKEALRRQNEEAVSLGIFGAPSFVAAGELFWGNDRLEEAVDWLARAAAVATPPPGG
jgi:2-hydroxychromene-2-carboxylate isomerase